MFGSGNAANGEKKNGHGGSEKYATAAPRGRRGTVLVPPADVVETQDGYAIHLDLPGLRPEAIDVRLEDGRLTVTAERPAQAGGGGQVLAAERAHGWFERIFELPPSVDGAAIDARYENGTLTVILPKLEAAKPRIVAVKVSN